MKVINPVINEKRKSSDPFVTKYKGKYYSCFSDDRGVYVAESESLAKLSESKEKAVCESGNSIAGVHWFAPELHMIDGKWYIYGAPSDIEGYTTHTMSVLESDGNDPMGEYSFRGMIRGLENQWAIDGTVFENDGKLYMIWSGNGGLMISEMSDPFTLTGKQTLITVPQYDWENRMSPVVEGPFVLKKDGYIHIVYSASDSRCDDYCLGLITNKGGELLDASSWNKLGKPIFSKTEGIYGPGHCSFTKHESDHGDIDVMVYHANTVSGTGWYGRSVWLQPISWENGYPILGTPSIEVEL